MIFVFAVVTRAVAEMLMILSISASFVARDQVGRQMEVGQASALVKEDARSLDRDEHVRGAVVIMDSVAVGLDGLGKKMPRFPVCAEKV